MKGLDAVEIRLSTLERTKRVDAEFFSKRHLHVASLLKKAAKKSIAALCVVSDGNHFAISGEFADEGIPYYRGQDCVGHVFIEQSEANFITRRAFDAEHMRRSHLRRGDVLLSIVGTIGEASLVTSSEPATCSCKLAILRPNGVASEFLAVVLRSEIGRSQTERFTRGAVQMGLLLEDMDQLWIPRFSAALEKAIAALVRAAQALYETAKANLADAEQALASALGFGNWQPPEPLTYTRRASEASAAQRIDAEYFHPAKRAYLDRLRAVPGQPLHLHYQAVREMFDPTVARRDELVRNFDLTDALQPVLDDTREPMPAREVGSTKKRIAAGDVVISRLRAYLREIALVRTSPGVPAVGSSEFIVLRPRDAMQPRLSRAALIAFLRSLPVQTILKWSQDGSHHPRFGDEDLLPIPVPDAVCDLSRQIDAHFEAILTARHRARTLLDTAKRAVEIAIEQNEAAALNLIKRLQV